MTLYWPYLNLRQEEVLALRDVAHRVAARRLVVSILRPVDDKPRAAAQAHAALRAGMRAAVITNPDGALPNFVANYVTPFLTAALALPGRPAFPAIELRDSTTLAHVHAFVGQYAAERCVVIHREHLFSPAALGAALSGLAHTPTHVFLNGTSPALNAATYVAPGGRRVLVRDGFAPRAPNAAYATPPQSAFGNLPYTFRPTWDGFGDFAAIGDVPHPRSVPVQPNHHAFHLTEVQPGVPTVICRHFVSTVATNSTMRQKYQSALQLLMAHTGTPPASPFQTAGVDAYHASHPAGTVLGPPKRFSTMHHIEMMEGVVRAAGGTPFV